MRNKAVIVTTIAILAVRLATAQTVNVQSSGNTRVTVKNGRVKTSGDVVIGSGNIVERTIPCRSIHTVVSEGSMDITWVQSAESYVVVEGDDNIVDLYKVGGASGTVNINASRSFVSQSVIRATVFSPTLKKIKLSGSGDVDVQDCQANDFSIEISGSGDATVSGSVGNLRIRVSGSGDVDASSCNAESVGVNLNGSGDVTIFCRGRVSGMMDGTGDLQVLGGGDISVRNDGVGEIYR